MSSTLPRLDEPGDAELISAVRAGDVDAYGELFRRHVDAARRLGRQLVAAGDVDDLVSEAFAKVLAVLQRGGGPDLAFRAYLLTAVRRLHVDRIRATARLQTTDDLTPFDPGVPFRDTAVEGFESAAAAKAFASLPERWQLVLWHTEVEGQKPADVAPLLGMSSNAVSALAYRAREGLRQAFLSMHLQDADDGACRWTRRNLGAYVRNGLSRRDAARVEQHVEDCRACAAIYLELGQVNSNLAGLLAPLILGGAATAYVGSAATAAVAGKGGLLLLLDRAREAVVANAPATAAAGAAATVTLGGALYLGIDRAPSSLEAGLAGDLPAVGPADGGRGGGEPRDTAPSRERTWAQPSDSKGPDEAAKDDAAPTPPAGASPSPSMSAPQPGPQPGPQPDPPPDSQPEPPPEPPPDQQPEPPAEPPPPDLRVTASASQDNPATWRVVVHVAGATDRSELTITGSGSVVLTGDGRCGGVRIGSGSCTASAAPYTFTAVAPLGGSLTFTVSGGPDAEPGNNRVTVRLD